MLEVISSENCSPEDTHHNTTANCTKKTGQLQCKGLGWAPGCTSRNGKYGGANFPEEARHNRGSEGTHDKDPALGRLAFVFR